MTKQEVNEALNEAQKNFVEAKLTEIPEPEQPISNPTLKECNEKITFYDKEIDKHKTFDEYKLAFDRYNYWRDLKLKLYK